MGFYGKVLTNEDYKKMFNNQTQMDVLYANLALSLACKKLDKLSPTCPSGELEFLNTGFECMKNISCSECWKKYLLEKVKKGELNE